ncbi:MAG: DNA polymerase III subunit beta [Chloroflexota bacterium]|nr:DNA polymerase III subunit beta [Chloroflexota bacterium]
MKLTIPRDTFFNALQVVSRAVSSRSPLPSLGGIQLTAENGDVTLRATDTDLALTMTVADVTIEIDGSVLLPARLLVDVVRSLPSGDLMLTLRPEQRDVELTSGSAQFHLRTLSAEDFPRLPEFEGEGVTLPAPLLAETIDRVARAASRDEVRPILTGVLFQVEGNRLTMVATDSYRLSVKHAELENALPEPVEANVPARALRELARTIAQEGPDEVALSLVRNQAVFRAGPVVLATRLIDGQFPSWRQLIPESFEHEVRMPREELLEVARRIGQLAQRNAPLRFAFAEGELTVAAETPEVGDASESLPAPFSGEPLEIAFNPQFLIEGLESVDSDELAIKLSSPLRPGLLQPVGREDFSYLVMPIRLNV